MFDNNRIIGRIYKYQYIFYQKGNKIRVKQFEA